jgi:hypothetical protein
MSSKQNNSEKEENLRYDPDGNRIFKDSGQSSQFPVRP